MWYTNMYINIIYQKYLGTFIKVGCAIRSNEITKTYSSKICFLIAKWLSYREVITVTYL